MEERVKAERESESESESESGTATEGIMYTLASEFEAGDFLISTLSSERPSQEVIAILIEAQHTNSEHAVAQVISQGPNVLCRLWTHTGNNLRLK